MFSWCKLPVHRNTFMIIYLFLRIAHCALAASEIYTKLLCILHFTHFNHNQMELKMKMEMMMNHIRIHFHFISKCIWAVYCLFFFWLWFSVIFGLLSFICFLFLGNFKNSSAFRHCPSWFEWDKKQFFITNFPNQIFFCILST